MIIYGSYTGHFDRPEGLLDVDIFGSASELEVLVDSLNLSKVRIAGTDRYACYRIGKPQGWRFIDFQVCSEGFLDALAACGGLATEDFEGLSVNVASKDLCCLIKRIAMEELPFPNAKHENDLEGYTFEELTDAQRLVWQLFAADIKRVDAYLRSYGG